MDMRLGIIYDGGGFSGAYSVGYAKAVHAFGLKPVCCQGVSIGSLTSAGYVEKNGDPKEVEQSWLKIEREGPHSIFPILDIPRRIRKGGLFSNKGIYRLANGIDYRQLINSSTRFDTVVYNETVEKQEIFSNRDKRCIDDPSILKNAIVASCSLKGFLDPVHIGGNFYSDGIFFLIKPLAQAECNVIFIFLPTELIPALWTLGFEKGNISSAIKNGYESGSSTIENFLKKFS